MAKKELIDFTECQISDNDMFVLSDMNGTPDSIIMHPQKPITEQRAVQIVLHQVYRPDKKEIVYRRNGMKTRIPITVFKSAENLCYRGLVGFVAITARRLSEADMIVFQRPVIKLG